MTVEQTPDPEITGESRNGHRLPVSFPWYTGLGGVQQTDDGVRVAYIGRASTRVPAVGTIDGRPVKVIAAERSRTVDGMTVLTVEFVEDAA